MSDIRFQFILNGEPFCIAGAEGFGTFSAWLNWVKRDPVEYQTQKQKRRPDWCTTLAEWTQESILITAHTRDSKYPAVSWFGRELNVGDELTIRVLGSGDCDTPAHGTKDARCT